MTGTRAAPALAQPGSVSNADTFRRRGTPPSVAACCDGRSPGSRMRSPPADLPGLFAPSGTPACGSPPTVAGAAPASGAALTGFPSSSSDRKNHHGTTMTPAETESIIPTAEYLDCAQPDDGRLLDRDDPRQPGERGRSGRSLGRAVLVEPLQSIVNVRNAGPKPTRSDDSSLMPPCAYR